jgi:restriction endonuclease S subunit
MALIEHTIQFVKDQFQGANHKHPTWDRLASISILLPSLERQQQILEAIDGWTNLAQNEEVSLKILEKQIMFQVKEIGRGQPRVKLGEVCEIRTGKGLTKEDLIDGDVPVIGGGLSPMGYHNVHNKDAYVVVLAQVGANSGNVSRYPVKSWITNNGMTIHPKGKGIANDDILYYLLKNIQDDIKGFAEGTAQPKLSSASVLSIELQVPPLIEQHALQPDFDEIRHKHDKIAKYSKGMTQKLGLLAVFLSGANLIILDEPMSGLDPLARIALKKELLDYRSKNKTIFFSSHILSDIDEICNQIGVLHNSKLRYLGSPANFKELHQATTLDNAFLTEISLK